MTYLLTSAIQIQLRYKFSTTCRKLAGYLQQLWKNLHCSCTALVQTAAIQQNFYPAPDRGTGYCNRAISVFVYLFRCQQHYEKTAGPTDLHEIFREGVEWPWDDLIQFWVNSSKRVGGSKVKLFVITGHSYLAWSWSSGSRVLPPSDWECNEIAVFGYSLRRTRGRGLLCPAPQLVALCYCSYTVVVLHLCGPL